MKRFLFIITVFLCTLAAAAQDISVRTWQPERDPNFGLYGPGDF